MDSREELGLDHQRRRRAGAAACLPHLPRRAAPRRPAAPSPIDAAAQEGPHLQPQGRHSRSSSAPTRSRRPRTRGRSACRARTFIEHPLAVAEHPGGPAPGHDDARGRAAARHRGGHRRHARRASRRVRRRGRADRRRPDEARALRVPHPRAGAGRERPQDDRGDGGRHPRAADQARRPAPQHAHPRRAAPSTKQRRIATETLEIYAPLANRLGVQEIKWELEDLVVQDAASRARTRRSRSSSRRARGERHALIERASRSRLRAKLKELGVKAEVEGRPKHLYSIYEKMVIRGKEFNEIYDLVGVRILVESLRDMLRGARRGPRPLEAGPRPVQGLRRDAQVEHVPVAAHDGGGARRQAARDPDPHARHAPHGAVRHRRALALQGGRQAGQGSRPTSRGSGR